MNTDAPMNEFDFDKVPEYFIKTVVSHVKYLSSERMREEEMRAMQSGGRGVNWRSNQFNNASIDYSEPMLKPVVWNTYPIFLVQYGMLALFSVCSNLLVIAYIMRFKLYRDVTQAFLVNLSLCYFMQSLVVLPLTLAVLLIQNWIFGQFLCFFLPMLQDIPMHVVLITHLLIAWDRYRWLSHPLKARFPAFVCSCASWLMAIIIALPYPIYTTFIDLGLYFRPFKGVGICLVNLADDMEEYIRGLFVIMYASPVTILLYLYIKTERELRHPDPSCDPLAVEMFKARADARNKIRQKSAARHNHSTSVTYDLFEAEVEIGREKRTQKYIGAMAGVHILCVCPLMLLKLARMVLEETYENIDHLDLTYLMFVWIAFLPAALTPWIYATWMLSRPTKQRIRNYFGLTSLRHTHIISNNRNINESVISVNSSHHADSENGPKKPKAKKNPYDNDGVNDDVEKSSVQKKSILKNMDHKKRDLFATSSVASSNITTSTYCNHGLERDSPHFEVSPDIRGTPSVSVPHNRRLQLNYLQKNSDFNDTGSCITESEYSSRKDSPTTLSRDLEIIDLLERERSMDIQEGLLTENKRAAAKKPMVSRYTQASNSQYLTGPDIDGRAVAKSPLVFDDNEPMISSRKNSSGSRRSNRSTCFQDLSPNSSQYSFNPAGSRERMLPLTPAEVEKLHRINSNRSTNRNAASNTQSSAALSRRQRPLGGNQHQQPIYQNMLGLDM